MCRDCRPESEALRDGRHGIEGLEQLLLARDAVCIWPQRSVFAAGRVYSQRLCLLAATASIRVCACLRVGVLARFIQCCCFSVGFPVLSSVVE